MSKFKRALKSVAGLVNDVVPNEIKPVVKVGLSLIPGVGPALSAAYTATDAYGGGASFGKSLSAGLKSYAISQVAGAASRQLGLTTSGNDLTDALGQTNNEGILGLGSGAPNAAATLGATTATSAPALSAAEQSFLNKAAAVTTGAATAPSSGLFTFDNLVKGASLAGGIATAASALSTPKAPSAPNITNTPNLSDQAATTALEEEARRKRRGATSNIYTSPLGLGNGQSAAAQLLG